MKFEVTKMGLGPTTYHIRILQEIFSMEVIESQQTLRQKQGKFLKFDVGLRPKPQKFLNVNEDSAI